MNPTAQWMRYVGVTPDEIDALILAVANSVGNAPSVRYLQRLAFSGGAHGDQACGGLSCAITCNDTCDGVTCAETYCIATYEHSPGPCPDTCDCRTCWNTCSLCTH